MNKKTRLKYIGFNDFWFATIGVFLLSVITTYLFNSSILEYALPYIIINWSISLVFSFTNWMILRRIMIELRKRYPDFNDNAKRAMMFFLLIVLTVNIVDVVGNLILAFVFGQDYNPLERSKVIIPIVIISVMTMAIYEAIYFFLRLKKSVRDEEAAKQAIVQAKLDALSNQAQPHFFFNSLNTLRDIIDENPREDAKLFVDKLANIYRFILESNKSKLITVKEEMNFAQSYIYIQKERFGENLKVLWQINEDQKDKMVVPMSLQLLLENAIKHNVISKAKPLIINVETKQNELLVENNLQLKTSKIYSTKMGLNNIKKRYQLISSKDVLVQESDDKFKVVLPLLTRDDQKIENEDINN